MEQLGIHGGKPVSEMLIPMAKPMFSEEAVQDVARVIRSGLLRQGPKTREFEIRFMERTGARYAYAVSSGTAALHTVYLSALKPRDEVIAPAFSFFATVSTVLHAGSRPVFADIDPETFLIDTEDVNEKITPKTRAITPVHLFGAATDVDALLDLAEDHDLLLIHDSAQAHGTEVGGRDIGSFDTAGCFSFYPTKSMTTGEGGMVTTNDEKLYESGKLYRSHGEDGRYHHVKLGLNYRMTEMAAVLGLDQLRHLDEFLGRRRRCGRVMAEGISKITGLQPQKTTTNVNHSYSYFSALLDPEAFRCTRREFVEAVRAENIDCAVHYPMPLTEQPIIKELLEPERCPVSEMISRRIFSLPMHAQLSDEDLKKIIRAVEKVSAYFSR